MTPSHHPVRVSARQGDGELRAGAVGEAVCVIRFLVAQTRIYQIACTCGATP